MAMFLALVTIFDFSAGSAFAARGNECEPEIIRASKTYNIPVGILYAVGLTETGRKGSLQPNALNIAGKAVFASSRQDALRQFNRARQSGISLIDLGCMQINHRWHGEKFKSVEQMLEPHQNVDYAARFLVDLKARHGSWSMAVARYHAGPDNDPAQKRYICRVIANMVATGMGAWTSEARKFCK